MPGHSGLGWWVNRAPDGTRLWKSAPEDAFGGAGAGHQFLLVVPSLDLIVVRNGQRLDPTLPFDEGLDRYVVAPVVRAISATRKAPYPPSPVIKAIHWAPQGSIVRKARGSDTWPMTWADDDAQYTAFGDGQGFDPPVPEKLSLGFARVVGPPEDFAGINIRSATGERKGDGAEGEKASGMLSVGGVLYMWARNAGNSRLAWSSDHAKTWTWSDWRFEDELRLPDVPELRQGLRRGQGRLRLHLLPGWRQRLPGRRPDGPGEGAQRAGSPNGGPTSSSGARARGDADLDRGHRRTPGGLRPSGGMLPLGDQLRSGPEAVSLVPDLARRRPVPGRVRDLRRPRALGARGRRCTSPRTGTSGRARRAASRPDG